MTDRNVIVATTDDFFKAKGLIKHSGSWYQRTVETISVLNLQKSQYGRRYYLNFGVWLLSVGDSDFPKPYKCHLVGRADHLVKEKSGSKRIEVLLDLEQTISDTDRRTELMGILEATLAPFLEHSATVTDLREGNGRFIVAAAGVKRAVADLFPPK